MVIKEQILAIDYRDQGGDRETDAAGDGNAGSFLFRQRKVNIFPA